MSTTFPLVDVAAVLITGPESGKLLLDYNPRWGDFAFPMTKVGELPGATPGSAPVSETAAQAAVRAAIEVLGRPLPSTNLPVAMEHRPAPYQRSGRDGEWKRYNYLLFRLHTLTAPQPLPGHSAVWLTPAELRTHVPLSPTVAVILGIVPLSELGL